MLLFVKRAAFLQIQAGTKTATIRPWRRCSLQPGATLSFNGRLRCTLTAVVPTTIAALTDRDAHAAGFPSRAACRRTLRALYPQLAADAPCVVLHFRRPE